MIAEHYGKRYTLQTLRERSYLSRDGVSLAGISAAAESIGLRTLSVSTPYEVLARELPLPCIVHWQQNHFVVVHQVDKDKVHVADPAMGLLTYEKNEFVSGWARTQERTGITLLLEPTPEFFENEEAAKPEATGFRFLLSYLVRYKKLHIQLFLGLLLGSLLSLIVPFLTQSLVDVGVNNQNIDFVYLVLMGQLMIFISRVGVEFIRSWILLHVGTRVNVSIISDFLMKLMRLPMSFFDGKLVGDILQRINDHRRVEAFLTASTLNVMFSLVNLLVLGSVLALYSGAIFLLFLVGSAASVGWILLFMKRRMVLDYRVFREQATSYSSLLQVINGIREIKLNNCERQKRWDWERIQAKLFHINQKALALDQYQQAGALSLNELKNILITFVSAKEVIEGRMTLGMMLAVSYILGQLNSPITQMLGFLQRFQDARLSLDRLGDIKTVADEDPVAKPSVTAIPKDASLVIEGLSFRYDGPESELVLNDIDAVIPAGKITAIVGTSGSGKTTLIKLLLKFYPRTAGGIRLGQTPLDKLHSAAWRSNCGVVMQDGFVFSDTIAGNVCLGDQEIDRKRLAHALEIANLSDFVDSLPLTINTRIGPEGHGLSQGQIQRVLIARAVYKDPSYLFLDEATSSLDANNEKVIMDNLGSFFEGRTVVIVAHRLSTVKNADQILVLEKGRLIEQGTHSQLVARRGAYYHLVKNQLELGQ
jgi:ATP-binding cassette subfamily B protein